MTQSRRFVYRTVTVMIAISPLLILEWVLSSTNVSMWLPRHPRERLFDPAPVMTEFDESLGWVNRPGTYSYKTDPKGVNPITVTIDDDHSRGLALRSSQRDEVWFFGGSFTFGWGVTDGEEFSAVVNERGVPARNFDAIGYGTVQSYLLYLRQRTLRPNSQPKWVVYALIYHHAIRNVAPSTWLSALRRTAEDQAWVKTPYARFSGDELKFYPPRGYQKWPLSEYSALSALAQNRLGALGDSDAIAQSDEVTVELMRRWNMAAQASGSGFVIMLLDAYSSQSFFYRNRDQTLDIRFVDCVDAEYPSAKTVVLGELHPNHLVHERWATCFMRYYEDTLRAPPALG